MARIRIDPDLARAINRNQNFKGFDGYARKNYGIPGRVLLARLVAGEAGGKGVKRAGVSSAGARGPTQFIPSTRAGYIKQYGLDPWRSNDEAIKAAIIHIKGTGLAGYNPGMPTYTDYILGQRTTGVSGAGGSDRRARANSRTVTRTQVTPGIDQSALRQQLKLDYLDNRHDPDALLELAYGLQGAEDIPGSVTTTRSTVRGAPGRGRAGNGDPIMGMLRKAVKWDRAKVPYLWGGGHGRTAKPGEPVDCSGFVSAILGLKTPLVSGQLMSWGKPGKGRNITVYASPTHTFLAIRDPRTGKARWFGTSKSNPGGGAGEMKPPSASYLSGFTARHPG